NRKLYYLQKWGFFALVLAFILWI
ncbi:hypothetical protein AAA627_10285, partial [Pseudomonas aeruginosa]